MSIITQGVAGVERCARPFAIKCTLFDAFTPDNDPYGEHNFGSITLEDTTFFWKIDYYDLDLHMHSPDPSDETVTARVLTIMLAEEY